MKKAFAALTAVLLLAVGAGLLLPRLLPPTRPHQLRVGDFYSVDNSDGGFRVIKILAVKPGSLEVCLYGNHFEDRPREIDAAELSLAPDEGYEGPGFASLAVDPAMFAAWKPRFIQHPARVAEGAR